uniref:Urotensin-2 n=2 Tax=Myotis myotis TaxID=51298 RepID=A0A7J8A2Y1_MYOMY|nr:urotensin 2 [Myotis myotis]
MYRLACCLLFLACLQPLLSLPAPGARAGPLQLSAADGGGSARDELDRASLSLLRGLLGTPGAETADGLGKADAGTNVRNPRGNTRKAFSGQDPDILLNRLLARVREQHEKRGHPSECFWKYCV